MITLAITFECVQKYTCNNAYCQLYDKTDKMVAEGYVDLSTLYQTIDFASIRFDLNPMGQNFQFVARTYPTQEQFNKLLKLIK